MELEIFQFYNNVNLILWVILNHCFSKGCNLTCPFTSPNILQDEEKRFNDHTKLVTYRELPLCLFGLHRNWSKLVPSISYKAMTSAEA